MTFSSVMMCLSFGAQRKRERKLKPCIYAHRRRPPHHHTCVLAVYSFARRTTHIFCRHVRMLSFCVLASLTRLRCCCLLFLLLLHYSVAIYLFIHFIWILSRSVCFALVLFLFLCVCVFHSIAALYFPRRDDFS